MNTEEASQTVDQAYPKSQQPPSYPTMSHSLPQVTEIPTQQTNPAALAGKEYRDQLFAQCAAGNHERTKTYGICGIITAIACFPCGLICLFADTKEKCARCGVLLEGN